MVHQRTTTGNDPDIDAAFGIKKENAPAKQPITNEPKIIYSHKKSEQGQTRASLDLVLAAGKETTRQRTLSDPGARESLFPRQSERFYFQS